jgi:hypothetical protein
MRFTRSKIVLNVIYSYFVGRAVAEAAGRWLPTAAARVRVRAAFGVCGGQSGTGAGFLRVLRFPQLQWYMTFGFVVGM